MSITIHQNPNPQTTSSFHPGFNDIIFVVSSSNVAQANFQYICDLYLTDETGALTHAGQTYIREKTPAEPTYTSGVFNIKDIVKSFLSHNIGDATYGFQKCSNSIVEVVCKFGEEYGASSAITAYPNLTNTSTRYFWNGLFDFPDIKDYSGNYSGSSSSTLKFLTARPQNGIIRSNERAWLYTLDLTECDRATVVTYDNAGAIIATHVITNSLHPVTSTGENMIRFPAGPLNLNSIPASAFVSGAQPIYTDGVMSYSITMTDTVAGQVRDKQYYYLNSECTDSTIYRFHFWNKLGGFDSFSFIRAHTFETDIKRQNFKRNTITRQPSGNYGYAKDVQSDIQFNTNLKDTIKVTSDWVSEATTLWLEELLTSPVIYLDDATHGLIAINPIDTKYIRKQWRTDGLHNLEFTFQYSYDRFRQSQ